MCELCNGGGVTPPTKKQVDNKVKDYLERAKQITFSEYPKEQATTLENIIEIAKMIQKEELE